VDPNEENGGEEEEEDDDDDNLLSVDVDEGEQDGADEDGEEKVEKPISVEQLEENIKQQYQTMTIRILRFF
jgi:hypothetical protein